MEYFGGRVAMTLADERATLVILVNEARRLALTALRKEMPHDYRLRLRELNAKWASVRGEVRRLLDEGASPREVRATLSGWYPFLGVIGTDEIEEQRLTNERWIRQLNARHFPSSAASQMGMREGWVFCNNVGNISAYYARQAEATLHTPTSCDLPDEIPPLLSYDPCEGEHGDDAGDLYSRFDGDAYLAEYSEPVRDPLDVPIISENLLLDLKGMHTDDMLPDESPPPLLPMTDSRDDTLELHDMCKLPPPGAHTVSPCPSSDSLGEASSGSTSPRSSPVPDDFFWSLMYAANDAL